MPSTVKTTPVVWNVQRLMCDCGGEFHHTLNTKYSSTPYLHVCDKCNAAESKADVYPKTVWEEA